MTTLEAEVAALEESLACVYSVSWSPAVRHRLYGPPGHPFLTSVADAYATVAAQSSAPLPAGLVPLALVDERSLACVVAEPELGRELGTVVRWHLDEVPPRHQAASLDVDPLLYVKSLEEEMLAREPGLNRILDEIGPAYEESYIDHDKRPRDFVVRPVRLACQNVIVGLAAIAQESSFDGLSVPAWQTCEVPHVATHEANRALAALTLCDAFQSGGTMEIRFDRATRTVVNGIQIRYKGHPEGRVPASLRRYGRTVGLVLGSADPGSISPAEARELFLAVTPMPDALRERARRATDTQGITPERLCFTLLSQTWREIELDFLLACTSRAASILEGGADWRDRSSRQAEMEVCRAAVMVGMYYRRLDGNDNAGGTDGVRVVEDAHVGVEWEILEETSAVAFRGVDLSEGIPWGSAAGFDRPSEVTVLPRSILTEETVADVERLRRDGVPVALMLPLDVLVPDGWSGLPVLRCPDRKADIDQIVEGKLLSSRISRG